MRAPKAMAGAGDGVSLEGGGSSHCRGACREAEFSGQGASLGPGKYPERISHGKFTYYFCFPKNCGTSCISQKCSTFQYSLASIKHLHTVA